MKVKEGLTPKLPPMEPGVYLAVCVGVIGIGEQYDKWANEYQNKVMLVWEIPSETVEINGKQETRLQDKEFKWSDYETSNLRSVASTLMGRSFSDTEFRNFDLDDLVGTSCQIQVVQSSTGKSSYVKSVVALPKGFPIPKATVTPMIWWAKKWNDEAFAKLPEWIQHRIKKSTQYQKEHAPETEIKIETPATEGVCPI